MKNRLLNRLKAPLAITMWDFSWIERRWPGAGYEDWALALDELAERGYNAIRLDAFPHFIAEDPEKEWEILPRWSTNDWGSPGRNRVRLMPELLEFMTLCRERDILIGLSSWFREDVDNVRMKVVSGQEHGRIWLETLRHIRDAGLMDTVAYLDFCNEWPADSWAPFYPHPVKMIGSGLPDWRTPECVTWMKDAVALVRGEYPDLPLTFSLWPMRDTDGDDLAFLDFIDAHLWVPNENDINTRMGYGFELHDLKGYHNLALNAEKLYRAEKPQWQAILRELIEWNAEVSSRTDLPMVTTECWAITDYKDWPLLNWDWIKELCALGTEHAVESGRWAAVSTSNFCGPQFKGMWRDVAWHQRLTSKIRSAPLPKEKG